MNKQQFLAAVADRLSNLPQSDINKSLEYYSEMIDDRMEDGMSEEDAVGAMGTIDEVVSEILMNTPLSNLVKAKVKPKRTLKGWEILLIILGAPLWGGLLIAAAAIVFSAFVVLWSLVVALYAVVATFVSLSIYLIDVILSMAAAITPVQIAMMVGLILMFIGLAIFVLLLSNWAAKQGFRLSKRLIIKIKSNFVKRSVNK